MDCNFRFGLENTSTQTKREHSSSKIKIYINTEMKIITPHCDTGKIIRQHEQNRDTQIVIVVINIHLQSQHAISIRVIGALLMSPTDD